MNLTIYSKILLLCLKSKDLHYGIAGVKSTYEIAPAQIQDSSKAQYAYHIIPPVILKPDQYEENEGLTAFSNQPKAYDARGYTLSDMETILELQKSMAIPNSSQIQPEPKTHDDID